METGTESDDKPQLKPHEIAALCSRLEARAESVLMVATPEQRSDMRTAARLLRQALSKAEGCVA